MDKKKLNPLARFRGFIQAGATLLTNIHLPNFAKGTLYQGNGKYVCVPGLNCYSCPGAAGACPVGAFQAVVGSSKFRFSYYITGILILFGVLLDVYKRQGQKPSPLGDRFPPTGGSLYSEARFPCSACFNRAVPAAG